MKRILIILISLAFSFIGMAQVKPSDTLQMNELTEVSIKARWKNDTERYKYNQMKHYVKIVLPYVNASTKLFTAINAKIEDPNVSRRDCKKYIREQDNAMRNQFEDKIKDLNITQGVLMVKLIARQTNLNLYKMINEVKNPIVAIKWQGWALVNGLNLDKKYHPEDEMMLESIMYELGYPLPESYAVN